MSSQISVTKRLRIYERDNYTCKYCKKKFSYDELTLDHVYPKYRGGSNSYDNLVTCCVTCNREKANMTVKEYKQYKSQMARNQSKPELIIGFTTYMS